MQNTHYSCQILMTLEFSRQILEECSRIKLREYSSSWNQVTCERTDMTKLTVAFRNFANAPKNRSLLMIFLSLTHRHTATDTIP